MRPDSSEYPSFYSNYVDLVPETDLRSALIDSGTELVRMFGHHESNLTLKDYRYEEGKWTVAQVLLHLVDSESVFLQRALWAARNEPTPLPGYDHNKWIEQYQERDQTVSDLIQWFRMHRQSTVMFYEHLLDNELNRTLVANGHSVSVRALGYIIVGHTRHHADVLHERYML